MNISIIGGAGFIGSRLSNRIHASKNNFKIIDKVESPFYKKSTQVIDIRDVKNLTKEISAQVL